MEGVAQRRRKSARQPLLPYLLCDLERAAPSVWISACASGEPGKMGLHLPGVAGLTHEPYTFLGCPKWGVMRWGLERETCALHSLSFLFRKVPGALGAAEVCRYQI